MGITPAILFVLIGSGQGLVLSAALYRSPSGNAASNRALASLLLLLSVMIATGILSAEGIMPSPHLYRVPVAFNFLFGPFLLFYFRSLLGREPAWKKGDLWHFLPFAACLIYLVPAFLLDSAEKVARFQTEGLNYPLSRRLMGIAQCTSVVAYSVYSAVLYHRFSRTLYRNLSQVDERHLRWLRLLLYSYLGFGVLSLLNHLMPNGLVPPWIWPLGGALTLLGLGYLGYFRPMAPAAAVLNAAEKEKKTGLKLEKVPGYRAQLESLMEREKPFLDGNLSLQKLARRMGIPSGQLSLLLNEHMKQSFFELVNSYRVREAKRLLDDPDGSERNMLELGFEVGFNSKSTFYSAFRKHEGCTPLAYLEKTGRADAPRL